MAAMSGSPSFGLAAESMLPQDRNNAYLGVYAVSVFVRDQERSLRFYVDQLGFSLAFDVRLQIRRTLGRGFSSARHCGSYPGRT